MALNRRQFLIGAGGLAAAATTMGLAACAPGSSGGSGSQGGGGGGGTNLALAWWGNPTRNKNTQAEIDAYMKANPDVKISGQPGEFSSYWDKLATQTAGGKAPDIIQMDMNYISEYGSRGALLDLAKRRHVQVRRGHRRFRQDQRQAGRHQCRHQQRGHPCQPQGLREGQDGPARRQNLDLGPDDRGWCGGRLQSGSALRRGGSCWAQTHCSARSCASTARNSSLENGLGFDAAEAQAWYDLMVKGQKAKAFGTPEQISEEPAKPLDQSAIVVGTAAMQYYNSNQLEAVSAAAGQQMKMLRAPSLAGKATERKAWYKASMLWSASAKTKNPEAAIAWINWFANSPEAADIDLAERGIPPNAEILAAGQAQALPCATGSREVHLRHQDRGGHYPDRPTSWRRHDRRRLVPSRDRCPLRADELS